MRISNRTFSGERPKALAWDLAANEAQLALDCELVSGGIVAMRNNAFIKALAKMPLTIYHYEGQWLSWDERVSIVESPIGVNNPRLFWTGDGYPKQASAEDYAQGKSYRMGVPTPTNPSITGIVSSPVEEGATDISTFYVASFVNKWGEEGDKSEPSRTFSYQTGDVISVGSLGAGGRNSLNLRMYDSVVATRLYRLNQGEARFVAEITINRTTFEDATGEIELGEVFNTNDFVPPEEDLQGLHIMANDVALGFVGKTVYVSEPGQLNAWPYSFPVRSEIVGISSFDNTAVILTKGYPEVASIYDPQNISPSMLAYREPCVNQWSIVQGAGGVMYAAPSGLFFISSAGGQMLTQSYMDEHNWKALKPETFHAVYRDGQYMAWHEGDAEGRCMVFDSRESNAVLRQLSAYHQAAHVKRGTDDLYLADGRFIEKYQGGIGRLNYRWLSKEHGLGNPLAFTSARVISSEFSDATYRQAQERSQEAREAAINNNAASLLASSVLSVANGYGGAIAQDTLAGVALGNGVDVQIPVALDALVLDVMIMADSETMDITRVSDEEPYRLMYWDRVRHWEYELSGNTDVAQFDMAGSESEMHDGS